MDVGYVEGSIGQSANETASEIAKKASSALNKSGESLEEIGQNASETASEIAKKATDKINELAGLGSEDTGTKDTSPQIIKVQTWYC